MKIKEDLIKRVESPEEIPPVPEPIENIVEEFPFDMPFQNENFHLFPNIFPTIQKDDMMDPMSYFRNEEILFPQTAYKKSNRYRKLRWDNIDDLSNQDNNNMISYTHGDQNNNKMQFTSHLKTLPLQDRMSLLLKTFRRY